MRTLLFKTQILDGLQLIHSGYNAISPLFSSLEDVCLGPWVCHPINYKKISHETEFLLQ